MDLASIIGLVGGFLIVLMAILLGGSIILFINIPSILIVIVGALFVVTMKFSLGQMKGAVGIAAKAFMYKVEVPQDVIDEVVELAKVARKEGPLALESVEIKNQFLNRGIRLLVDSTDPKAIKSIMSRERSSTFTRHEEGIKIFKAINDVAPAMGMIGTLIGLVQMLANMSDPKSIGPAMAVALLTTLYGAIIGNMVATPIADKLSLRSVQEDTVQSLIIDAVIGMAEGLSPAVIEEILSSYLPVRDRKKSAA